MRQFIYSTGADYTTQATAQSRQGRKRDKESRQRAADESEQQAQTRADSRWEGKQATGREETELTGSIACDRGRGEQGVDDGEQRAQA